MKKEILKLLTFRSEDLHGKKRRLYDLTYVSLVVIQAFTIIYLGRNWSHWRFCVFVAIYFSIVLSLTIVGSREGARQRSKASQQ
jgi:hypothetical protein